VEKISNIVRGNSRVSSVDLKSSSAIRPGTPSYGRPVGEASVRIEREGTTASRAAELNLQLKDQRRSAQDRVVEEMADKFFMSRTNRLGDAITAIPKDGVEGITAPGNKEPVGPKADVVKAGVKADSVKADAALKDAVPADEKAAALQATAEAHETIDAPEEYTPRGSFVDVRA